MAEQSRVRQRLLPVLRAAAALFRKLGRPPQGGLHDMVKGLELGRRWPTLVQAHRAQKEYFTAEDLVRVGLPPEEGGPEAPARLPDTLEDVLREDATTYMPGDILVKLDRSSMAHGLELRSPFLDVQLASFCLSLPLSLKIDKDSDKVILRRAFSDEWPPSLRTRGKQGFGAPVASWLKRPSVVELKRAYLDDPKRKMFAVLSFAGTRDLVRRDDYLTWTLLVLSLWMEGRDMSLPTGGANA
jgi:asparagine synthase (glutamine-hydrolysing)